MSSSDLEWVAALRIGGDSAGTTIPFGFEGHSYILVLDGNSAQVFSSVCPHAGGVVTIDGDDLRCPNHGWRFDRMTGSCINAPSRSLTRLDARLEGTELLLRRSALPPPNGETDIGNRTQAPRDLRLTIHSHATLEVAIDGFSMVCDPWLRGPAFMGAWIQFPPPVPASLEYVPNAIWISHEHSDHFHEPTLRAYPRNTPIYVPAFANARLEKRCRELGFTDVTPVAFGEPQKVHDRIALTCYEPGSLWNDASALINIEGFRILNINDAGLNPRLRKVTGSVNLVSSAFGVGASGYPLTWGHIDDRQKKQIIEANRQGMFAMLREAVELYSPEYLLPFAGHFALWHPDHRRFVEALEPTHLDAVTQALSDTKVAVLDLYPGDSFVPASRELRRGPVDRAVPDSTQEMLDYCAARFDQAEFEDCHPTDGDVSREELSAYLLSLNTVPEIEFCEDLSLRFALTDFAHTEIRVEIAARICGGHLVVIGETGSGSDVDIAVPSGVMRRLIDTGESWDEAHIGYWCRFSRSPDIYHANFWRLLQAPRFSITSPPRRRTFAINRGSVIAEVLEAHGDEADRIIRRRGMYCVGCHRAPSETLEEGARNHGVSEQDLEYVLRELNALVAARAI